MGPEYLHKHNKNNNDHIDSFKTASMGSHKEFSDWTLISFSGKRSHATELPSGFACNTYRLGWVPQVLEVPKMSWDSFLLPPRKATFAPYTERLSWTLWIRKVPVLFSGRLQSQFLFLKASWWHPEPRQVFLRHATPVKVLVNKTTFRNRLYVSYYEDIRFLLDLISNISTDYMILQRTFEIFFIFYYVHKQYPIS